VASSRTALVTLSAPLTALRGLGAKRAEAWAAWGVREVGDLLRWPPRRHARFAAPTTIAALADGVDATVRVVLQRKQAGGRRGIVATRLVVADASGELDCVLFGPRWLAQAFARHEELLLRGTPGRRGEARQFVVRGWLHAEEIAGAAAGAALLQPHYELPDAIAPRLHRRCLRAALVAVQRELARPLPAHAAALTGVAGAFADVGELLAALHFPRDEAQVAAARRALALDEAIALQWRLRARREERPARPGGAVARAAEWRRDYVAAWPCTLTGDQQKALDELVGDYGRRTTMARLLTGDVGSGKTLVALFPLVVAARSGRQGALLAPTELLARQHFATLAGLAERLALPPPQLIVAGEALAARGVVTTPLVVGTHRLFAERLRFADLAAVVVDEQHKFGVQQRARLLGKGGAPDLLLVSATPIPRTLAQTLFGHLDPTLLRDRPFAQRQVATELLAGAARKTLGERLRAEIAAGGKLFVVCPAIAHADATESRDGAPRRRAAAERVAPWLARELRGAAEVALLHGQLAPAEKQARLDAFTNGRVRALVATVVIEVGLDVPDASLVVVLDAERFGLAQLHQIRGRVGRRGAPARCLLVSHELPPESEERLLSFARLDDGFALAELDLRLRGPGELLGARQHGLMGGLYPEALLDPDLLDRAREAVAAGVRKSLLDSPFGLPPVASDEAIW